MVSAGPGATEEGILATAESGQVLDPTACLSGAGESRESPG